MIELKDLQYRKDWKDMKEMKSRKSKIDRKEMRKQKNLKGILTWIEALNMIEQ